MVRAFMGQMLCVAAVAALSEHLPSWVLGMMLAAALLLPLATYVTIATQPPVYRAWQSALRELCHFGAVCIKAVPRCLSLKRVSRFCRLAVPVRTFPVTSDEWAALLLFPFRVFVLTALPFLRVSDSLVRLAEPRLRYARFSEAMFAISEGYVFCLGMLLFGALLQALFSLRGRSTQTVFVFLVGVVFFGMLRPWGIIGR